MPVNLAVALQSQRRLAEALRHTEVAVHRLLHANTPAQIALLLEPENAFAQQLAMQLREAINRA